MKGNKKCMNLLGTLSLPACCLVPLFILFSGVNRCSKKTLRSCFFLLFLLASLVLSVGFSPSVSAVTLAGGFRRYPVSGSITGEYYGNRYTFDGVRASNDLNINGLPANVTMERLIINLDDTITHDSIFTFSVMYRVTAPNSYLVPGIRYYGMASGNSWTLLNESCQDNGPVSNGNSNYGDELTCTYFGFTDVDLALVSSEVQSRLVIFENTNATTGLVDTSGYITVSPISARKLSFNGLTADDRAWLEAHMPSGSSQSDIEQAIVDAQATSREQERQEFEDEAAEGLDTLEDNTDQQAIDTKMTSILSVIQGFIDAVVHPVVSTCILPIHLENFHNFGFYEVDLCHLSPPSGITNVLNVIFLFFVLGLAYSAIRSIIQMYKEVIDG